MIALLETWTTDNQDFVALEDTLDDHKLLVVKHGLKFSKHGRASGVVLVFVKKICI